MIRRNLGSELFLFTRSFPVFLYYLSDSASLRLVSYSIRSAESLEQLMETPFDCFFNWLIEDVGQEGYSSETELYKLISDLAYTEDLPITCAYGTICPDRCILRILQCSTRVSDDTMYCESRQSHTCYALEHSSLHHHTSEILNGGHVTNFKSAICR